MGGKSVMVTAAAARLLAAVALAEAVLLSARDFLGGSSACLTITPYVMDVTSTSAIVRWESDTATTTRLCYRPAAGEPSSDGAAWSEAESLQPPLTRMHAASIHGLAPETAYEYKVLTADLPGASDCVLDPSLMDCESVPVAFSLFQVMAEDEPSVLRPNPRSWSRGGEITEPSSLALRFSCRAEYLSNREAANDFAPEPFPQYEVDLVAQLPEACDGETPVPLPLADDRDEYEIYEGEDDEEGGQTGGGQVRRMLLDAQGCGDLKLEFKTGPSPGQCGRRFRSWWLGDSGRGSSAQTSNLEAAVAYMERDWDATFAIGDNAYNSGTRDEYVSKFFAYYCRPFSHVGLYPTLGNHDAYSSNGPAMRGPYFDLFVPGHPTENAQGSQYSYQNGRVHVVMLDLSDSYWGSDAVLFAWLEDDLSAARLSGNTDWIIVANHFPAYSKGSHDSDKESRMVLIREQLVPIFEKHGVDVSLSGHSHVYERSHLLYGHHGPSTTFNASAHVLQAGTGLGSVFRKPRCGDSGMVHVVTGSSAKPSGSGSLKHPVHDVSTRALCTVVIHVEGTHLVSSCIGPGGAVIDRFTIVKDMNPAEGCQSNREYGLSCDSYPTPSPSSPPATVTSVISGLPVAGDTGTTGLAFRWASVASPPSAWASPSFDDSSWQTGLMPAGYGPDYSWSTYLPSNRDTGGSYLFRRTFCLTREQLDLLLSPDAALVVHLAADNRGEVWLNGVEIFAEDGRTNHEVTYWNQVVTLGGDDKGLLVAGANLLAVEVTNDAGSSDAGFDGDLRVTIRREWPEGECDIPAPTPDVFTSVISGLPVAGDTGTTGLAFRWASVASPPSSWASPSFDDSSWQTGLMPAGYGPDYSWSTYLPSNRDTGGSYLFRRTFCLTREQLDLLLSPDAALAVYLAADNRGEVWLNGVEIFAEDGRTNHEVTYWNQVVTLGGDDKGLLVAGANLLAVEVTNDAGSSDAGFDGDLRVIGKTGWPGGQCVADQSTMSPTPSPTTAPPTPSSLIANTSAPFLEPDSSSTPVPPASLPAQSTSWPDCIMNGNTCWDTSTPCCGSLVCTGKRGAKMCEQRHPGSEDTYLEWRPLRDISN